MNKPYEYRGYLAALGDRGAGTTRPDEYGPARSSERGLAPGTRSTVFDAARRSWSTWWSCDACGGVGLPTRHHPSATSADCAWRAHGLCPSCETRRRRHERAGPDPAIWYDTGLGDWALRVPCPGLVGGVVLPLGIVWFDASWPEVYRAACDIVYSGDELDEVPGGA